MKESFEPSAHRATYEKLEENVKKVNEKISGDKTEEEFLALMEERKEALAELDAEYNDAHDSANMDNEALDNITARRLEIEKEIQELESEKTALAEGEIDITGVASIEGNDTPTSINEKLKELGSPATVDTTIEGGVVSLEIDQKTMEALHSYDTAIQAYKDTDGGSAPWVYEELKNIPWTQPTTASLDVLILNHGETTSTERDTMVEDMDKAGYRPLTFPEFMALGIIRPDLNKRNETFNTYEKYTLGGRLRVPNFSLDVGVRGLSAVVVSFDWYAHYRFLFVRKS